MEYICYGGPLVKEVTRYFEKADDVYKFTDRVMWNDNWIGCTMVCEKTGHTILIEKGMITEN